MLLRAGQICYREEGLASDADVTFEVETRGGSECLFVFAHGHDHKTLVLTQTRTGGDEVPQMTFSLRPSSVSTLPLIAASLRTFVVSWKLLFLNAKV